MRPFVLAAALLLAAPAAHARVAVDPAIAAAVAAPERTPADRARDRYRHPAETLAFFGLKPGMTVVEITPGGGWFTPILARAVGAQGHLYAALPDPKVEPSFAPSVAKFKARFPGVTVTPIGPGSWDIAPAGSADMVVTFRNVHNFMGEGGSGNVSADAFRAFYRALKPGGVLGLEEHRLPEARMTDLDGSKGYVKQSSVIAMAKAAGFRLIGTSEVNANPRDTADYPAGVWTLPPTYAEKDKDRAKYAAIGESDRMTLKFEKPAA